MATGVQVGCLDGEGHRLRAHQRLCAHHRGLRRKAGLTQANLAAKLAKPQSFVSSNEARQRHLDLTELDQIAKALGVTLDSLVAIYSGRR